MSQVATAEAFDDLLDTSTRLTDLIAAEIAALRAMRPRDIAPLQEEKAQLTARYGAVLAQLRANPEMLKGANPARRGQLRQAVQQLRDVIGDNLRALKAARIINEKMIRVIADAVAAQTKPTTGYTAVGTEARTNPNLDSPATPITINEKV